MPIQGEETLIGGGKGNCGTIKNKTKGQGKTFCYQGGGKKTEGGKKTGEGGALVGKKMVCDEKGKGKKTLERKGKLPIDRRAARWRVKKNWSRGGAK